MRQPEIVAKVHSPEVAAKRGAKKRAWLASGTVEANAQIERIRALNPMSRPEVRAKVSAILRGLGHRPQTRGGNGRGPSLAQRTLFEILGAGWYLEYPISLGKRQAGYPTAYKVDIGNPSVMVAVEVDGNTHYSRKELDAKKDGKLTNLGWRIVRVRNKDVLASAQSVVDKVLSACANTAA